MSQDVPVLARVAEAVERAVGIEILNASDARLEDGTADRGVSGLEAQKRIVLQVLIDAQAREADLVLLVDEERLLGGQAVELTDEQAVLGILRKRFLVGIARDREVARVAEPARALAYQPSPSLSATRRSMLRVFSSPAVARKNPPRLSRGAFVVMFTTPLEALAP
jgi:hypothetical protein